MPNVVVTGFGPFRSHERNTSWEAIKDGRLELDRDVELIIRQIAVSYLEVDRATEELWTDYNPILMVHIGLAADISSIKVEQIARYGPYLHDDEVKYAPHTHLRVYNPEESLSEEGVIKRAYTCGPCQFGYSKTCLDLVKVSNLSMKEYHEGRLKFPTLISEDAGKYVCEYLYFKSLEHSDRTVFIHVPDMEKFDLQDITKNLKFLIELLIDEVNDRASGVA